MLPSENPPKKNLNLMNKPLLAQSQTNVDGDQIVLSAKTRKRKNKIGMAIARNNYNRKHHLSQKYRYPKQGGPRLWITRDPRTHRIPAKINIQVSQKSACNGKQRWKDLTSQNTNALISFVGNVSANGMPFLVRDITLSAFHSMPM